MHVQAFIRIPHVKPDGSRGLSLEFFSTTLIAVAFGQELQNFKLPRRQPSIGLRGRRQAAKCFRYTTRQYRGDMGAPPACNSRMEASRRAGSVSFNKYPQAPAQIAPQNTESSSPGADSAQVRNRQEGISLVNAPYARNTGHAWQPNISASSTSGRFSSRAGSNSSIEG